jgi:archaemetzincin
MQYIYIEPIGLIEKELLDFLSAKIEMVYDCTCMVAMPLRISGSSHNLMRGQYNAKVLMVEIVKNISFDEERLLCVVDVDLFVPGLNFVFGLAIGNTTIISLVRLRPEYYGERKNEYLFKERALKEAVHELGHTFGLHHCPDIRCIMHFSNHVENTDIKGPGFCKVCSNKIEKK